MDSLKECKIKSGEYLRLYDGFPTEYDMSCNDISRDTITAMKKECGSCFLGKINLSEGDKPLTEYTGQKIYNFQCDFIIPVHNTEIEQMIINDRTNIKVKDIIDRVYDVDGTVLIWS